MKALSLAIMAACLSGCYVGEALDVVHDEFGPKAALQKYEWFKDAAAALEKKRANINVYKARLGGMKADYQGLKRSEWPRSDREQYNLWRTEVAGVIASYNDLAAEYNAQMAKFNWKFAEAGSLPSGASKPLPREFKPYIEE